MKCKTVTFGAALLCSVLFATSPAVAQKGKADGDGGLAGGGIPELNVWRVATGLARPVFLTAPPGDFNRAFILEQHLGQVRVLNIASNPPALSATVYLDLTVSTGNEQGLLGLAFHPGFLSNGYFYVNYTNTAGTTVIARYRANAPYATSTTAVAAGTTILTVAQPFTNHNGGWIGFAPNDTEGYLYIGMGDGGGANDTAGNAQNINSLLGKMLRIDIDGPDNIPGNADDDGFPTDVNRHYTIPPSNPFADPLPPDPPVPGANEIWAYGLRNPWRPSFDRLTNDFYIADVGQNAWEEIDFQPAASAGGENYGWRCMEGNACTGLTGCTCNAPTLSDPIHVYGHGSGCSITGGYVYRGGTIPGLQGTYFFADYCSNTFWTFTYSGSVTNFTVRTSELAPGGGISINSTTSFGEDAAGEMYICDQGGEIFKIVEAPPNDKCTTATTVGDGTLPFNNANANTDGPTDTMCTFTSAAAMTNDLWYNYTATCTGTARVSVCGSTMDTRILIYGGGACPTASNTAIACNNDFCGTSSEVAWNVTSGQLYRIRLGSVNSTYGSGDMVISCTPTPPPCPWDVNGSGTVNVSDLLQVIGAWGNPGGAEDVNGDGIVNVTDLLAVIAHWGACP